MHVGRKQTGLLVFGLMTALAPVAGCAGPAMAAAPADARAASEILTEAGVKGGLIVHLGCGDGKLTVALATGKGYLVHGLETDRAKVEVARAHIRARGLYGKVSVEHWTGARLPYIDNLVNLLVAEELGEVPMAEVMRVLAPGGMAYVKADGSWTKTPKPRPAEIDEWTHYLHDASNNAVAHDALVGPPRRLQWVGSPRWARHHDHMASTSALVSAGGRLFYIFDEGPTASIQLPPKWMLIARDAFNGTILWKRPIAKWHTHLWPLKSGPAQLPRRLVTDGKRVYVTLGLDAPLTALDAATGETIRTYADTAATREIIASEGQLFLLVAPPDKRPAAGDFATVADVKRAAGAWRWRRPMRRIVAVEADTGKALWEKDSVVAPLTLAADDKHVYFHDGKMVVALDRSNGEEVWRSKPLPVWSSVASWFAPSLVVHEGTVLFAGGEGMVPHRGGKDSVTALSADTGETLWSAEHPPGGYQSPEDLFVIGGLVWAGATTNGRYSGVFTGRDLRTGEVRSEFPPDLEAYWFHHRCYRAKATDRFILCSRTGIEFIDLAAKRWTIHHWVRGGCLYGLMPCNGLIYAPAHACACYPEAKLHGFHALAAAGGADHGPAATPEKLRLQRGPAYGEPVTTEGTAQGDWPTYRHDPARSGFTSTPVPTDLEPAWQTHVGGKLSAVTVAAGKVLLADVNAHTVHALDVGTGEKLWSFTADGRVDSPPTVHAGRVLFGSADGFVYCLRASDGVLAWRFQAAPQRRNVVASEQVESVWPVHGSVLLRDGAIYCVAGRSMFLDGGLRLIRLDPATGRKLAETVLDDRDPTTGENLQTRHQNLNMPVALPDVLSGDGEHIYMRSQRFDPDGSRPEIGPHSGNNVQQGAAQHGEGTHLFAPMGFLDGSWFHRSYWVYGRSFAGGAGGYYQAGRFAPGGRIMVVDDARVYAFGRKPQYYRWTTPLEYRLYAASKRAPEVPKSAMQAGGRRGRSLIVFANTKSLDPANKPLTVMAWVRAANPNGAIVARGGSSHGYSLLVRAGRPQFAVRINEEAYSVTAEEKIVGKWVHLAGVLTKDGQLQIYVDGKLAGKAKAAGLITVEPKQAMEVGCDDGSSVSGYPSPFVFTGLVDELRIFHGTVTANEIHQHCATPATAAVKDATLVLSCSFDDGEAADASGNNNNGQMVGGRSVKGKVGKAVRFAGRTRRRSGLAAAGGSFVKPLWTQEVPLLVRGMVLADKTLFVAGPPDVVDEAEASRHRNDAAVRAKLVEQAAALQGARGALLRAVSADDGKKLAEYKLRSPPVWDGLAAANGKLFLATMDGKVICFGNR